MDTLEQRESKGSNLYKEALENNRRKSSKQPTNPPMIDPADGPTAVEQTPHREGATSTGSKILEHTSTKILGDELEEQMHNEWGNEIEADDFIETFFGQISEKKAALFRDRSGHYADGRWTFVPETIQHEAELYDPLQTLMADILRFFHRDKRVSVRNTDRSRMRHAGGLNYSMVDIMFLGFGGSISAKQSMPLRPSYADNTCLCEIKPDANLKKPSRRQVLIYSREQFAQQANRRFVVALVVSEKNLQVHIIDRSGILSSKVFDYHKRPIEFVRLIAAMGSPNHAIIGFDPSVYWDEQGNQFINTVDKTDVKKITVLRVVGSVHHTTGILGRGTAGWKAVDKDDPPGTKAKYFVKDSWRSWSRRSEGETLTRISDEIKAGEKDDNYAPGVLQLVRYGDVQIDGRVDDVWQNRLSKGKDIAQTSNRIHTRIVTKYVGPTLNEFESDLQLVQAFLDAVLGLRWLYDRKLLHRDVSCWNIFIGTTPGHCDTIGRRGVMGDYDYSIWGDRDQSSFKTDFLTGTRPFQSLNVLKHGEHTFMDDLESFYYVMCWIVTGYDGPKTRFKALPFHHDWDADSVTRAAAAKVDHLMDEFELPTTNYFQGSTIHGMVYHLHGIFRERNQARIQERVIARSAQAPFGQWSSVPPQVLPVVIADEALYKRFIGIVEEAEHKLKETPGPLLTGSTTSSMSTNTSLRPDPIPPSSDAGSPPANERSPSPCDGKGKQPQRSSGLGKRRREDDETTEAQCSESKRSRTSLRQKSRAELAPVAGPSSGMLRTYGRKSRTRKSRNVSLENVGKTPSPSKDARSRQVLGAIITP